MNSETKHPKSCYMYLNDGKLYGGPLWDFDWNTLPTSTSYSEEGYSYTSSMLIKADCNNRASSYPTKVDENDKSYMWYPMLVKSSEFKKVAAERWNAVKGALQSYVSSQIPAMQAKIATSEAVNNSMWAIDSKSSPKRSSAYGIGSSFLGQTFSCGYCGDEGMTFEKAVQTLQTTLTTRINGMSFVSDQNWTK